MRRGLLLLERERSKKQDELVDEVLLLLLLLLLYFSVLAAIEVDMEKFWESRALFQNPKSTSSPAAALLLLQLDVGFEFGGLI